MSEATEFKNKGNQALKEQKYDEALENYGKAIELDSQNPIYFSNRSLCFIKMEKFDEALKDAEECLKVDPNFVKGYLRKGLALFKQGNKEEALKAYNDGLVISPDNKKLLDDKQAVEQSLKSGGQFDFA